MATHVAKHFVSHPILPGYRSLAGLCKCGRSGLVARLPAPEERLGRMTLQLAGGICSEPSSTTTWRNTSLMGTPRSGSIDANGYPPTCRLVATRPEKGFARGRLLGPIDLEVVVATHVGQHHGK